MRTIFLLAAFLPLISCACTTFKVTADGHTLVGCNEDAWSINAQVRFEQGRDGQYGAIHFGHFNGSPLRSMTDQMGMNEAGLVFDGLSLQRGPFKQRPGVPWVGASDAALHVMRTCATVQEVAAYARTVQVGLVSGMLFFCDRNGGYLLIEPDTMIMGNDPWYAVGNWRMSTCGDPGSIPIPRLQEGRKVLAAGEGNAAETAEEALRRMAVCRSRMGEGTLFSALFDPERGQAHLFFYHDFSEHVTFDLKEELAKGARTVDMASLFGTRPEYDALVAYITPFHQRWLFWGLVALFACSGLLGLVSAVIILSRVVPMIRGRAARPWLPDLLTGLICAVVVAMVPVLLLNEGVYYFGLGDVAAALAFLPLILIGLFAARWILATRQPKNGRKGLITLSVLCLSFVGLLGYWNMLWP